MKRFIFIIAIIFILFILLTTSLNMFMQNDKVKDVKAIEGVINLMDWDFNKNGTVKLDGQWELYYNKLLSPEDLISQNPERYFLIPSGLKTQLNGATNGYMTLRLKILAPESIVYGFRIKRMLSASKVWVNGILQGYKGRVGKTYSEEKAIYLPIYSYFTAKDGIVDIVIQTSNFRDIFPVINSMDFGLKSQIMNKFLLSVSMDLIIIGSLFILELLFLSIYMLRKKDKTFLYFSILCFLIQLRCLFLNERIIVHFFPNMPYELLSKTAAITYYLWVPIYVLFLKEQFTDLSRKIIVSSSIFGVVFTIICLTTNNVFYDRLAFLSQTILFIIIFNLFLFLIKKVKEREKNSEISFFAFLVLFITAVNDILVNNGGSYSRYLFQIGMFIFAFLETHMLAINYSTEVNRLEELTVENQIIYEKSIRDSLTNLYNRNFMEQILINSINKYLKTGEVFTVLMIDIDHFKYINDKYGHLYGDKVLVSVSNMLKESLRATDYIGRYGGEEFLVILPNTNKVKAKEIAERIRNNVESFSWDEDVNITISAGLYENNLYTKQECIAKADKLLYLAKKRGRNRVEVMYTP